MSQIFVYLFSRYMCLFDLVEINGLYILNEMLFLEIVIHRKLKLCLFLNSIVNFKFG